MKIATYNVNGVIGRLPVLLRWLKEDAPDVVCLQELKATDETFPRRELQNLGYEGISHGQKSSNGVAILAKGTLPVLTRRELPGDPDDTHSRYIEAAINGILAGIAVDKDAVDAVAGLFVDRVEGDALGGARRRV